MTYSETASAMRRLADALDRVAAKHPDAQTGRPDSQFDGDAAVSAAIMVCYIRDLVMDSDHDVFDKPTLLVVLETISRDPELFPCGVGTLMWQMEDEG